ncbi:hypothetical protein [Rhizobium sp. Root1220]|uniref:hypothetical protein n=1 Tax=Rhizobium sp. Root1220 TaxID=1736432 RepID=UPI0012E3D755|nr:hypothetical protein [Rhizobium sp. Root1220]
MDSTHIERLQRSTVSGLSQWLSTMGRRLAWRLARSERLDLEGMPDRVKRDLGFMDGRDPRYDAELRR